MQSSVSQTVNVILSNYSPRAHLYQVGGYIYHSKYCAQKNTLGSGT